MAESAEASNAPAQDSPDWPEPPKVLTIRGVSILIGVLLLATSMSLAIVWNRQMPSEKTRAFWGPELMQMIGNARPIELRRPPGSEAVVELERYNKGWLDLTELRDIGYFRRAFLDDNNFMWESTKSLPENDSADWYHIRFGADPSETDAKPQSIAFHRNEGWVRSTENEKSVQFRDQVFRRLKYRLELIARLRKE